MIRALARAALLAVIAGTAVSLQRQARLRRAARMEPPPEPVQTWEAEGGALPDTGSQIGPEPLVPSTAAQNQTRGP